MTKAKILALLGAYGSVIAGAFGGWSTALNTLCIFMAIDYLSGFAVAGVFHKSPKSETGALESGAGLKGLLRKGMILTIVLVAHRLDLAVGGTYIKDGTCIAFILNEAVSIIENAGLMGIKIPEQMKDAIDALRKKGE